MGKIEDYLMDTANWKKTHKKKYDVYVCMPNDGTVVENFLKGAKYTTNQNTPFVLSGTVGEQWVIDFKELAKTYTFADGTEINEVNLKNKMQGGTLPWIKLTTRADAGTVWSCHLPTSVKNYPIKTSRGAVLQANRDGVKHGYGDFIMASDNGGAPNLKDVWVVNGIIFPRTYDLHAYANKFPDSVTNAETVVPKPLASGNAAEQVLPKIYKWFKSNFESRAQVKLLNNQVDDSISPKIEVKVNDKVSGQYFMSVDEDGKVDAEFWITGPAYDKFSEGGFLFTTHDIDVPTGPKDDWIEFRDHILLRMNEASKKQKRDLYDANKIAKALSARGHRIGKIVDDTNDNSVSFKFDNGKYGVMVRDDANAGTFLSLFGTNESNEFVEILGFFLDDSGIEDAVDKIHNVASGSAKGKDVVQRAYNETKGYYDSIYVDGKDVDEFDNDSYAQNCKYAYQAMQKAFGTRGFEISNPNFSACDTEDALEVFRIYKIGKSDAQVIVMNQELVYARDGEGIIDSIPLPDRHNKNDWKAALSWIVKVLK